MYFSCNGLKIFLCRNSMDEKSGPKAVCLGPFRAGAVSVVYVRRTSLVHVSADSQSSRLLEVHRRA